MTKSEKSLETDHEAIRAKLERSLFEIRRVIVGQEHLLERVFIALLAGGHLLIEGVPGLAKTLTVRTTARVLGGKYGRIQFTPDLVPSDLVGTRIYRPGQGSFDVELGPVFCNLLLADEINRAPAKVQSALLEVMQERQVTIGKNTYRVPEPFLVMATQNPIESDGTYPLPEAQVDRFLMKVVVDYPSFGEEVAVVQRSLEETRHVEHVLTTEELMDLQRLTRAVYVDPMVIEYAAALTMTTRKQAREADAEKTRHLAYGASPRGTINLIHTAQALALLKGRNYALPRDVADVTKDVLRHRLVLTYEALADGITADSILDEILGKVPQPPIELAENQSA